MKCEINADKYLGLLENSLSELMANPNIYNINREAPEPSLWSFYFYCSGGEQN